MKNPFAGGLIPGFPPRDSGQVFITLKVVKDRKAQ